LQAINKDQPITTKPAVKTLYSPARQIFHFKNMLFQLEHGYGTIQGFTYPSPDKERNAKYDIKNIAKKTCHPRLLRRPFCYET
jgi:hypothetical protein